MNKTYKKVGRRYVEVEPQRFNIDFFEFSFLVEACIPPTPIARAYFWQNVIDKYYYEMTWNERNRLFEWLNRNWVFQDNLKNGNEDCALFNARFNPENQFLVSYSFNGENSTKEAFLLDGEYHITKNGSILEKYITKVEKLDIKDV